MTVVEERPPSLLARVRAQNPLPEGAIAVGIGLAISGVATFLFLGIAGRALNDEDFSALSVLWAAMFAVGNGVMQPLEQEVARAVSDRRARGLGPAPVIRRAAAIGIAFSILLALIALFGHTYLIDRWFNGNTALTVSLVVGLFGFCAGHLTRGVLSSHHRFAAYARYFTVDGVSRVVLVGILALFSVTAVGIYGLMVALPMFLAVGAALAGQHGFLVEGPPAPWSELTQKLGWLLLGTGMLALLVGSGTIAVQMLAEPGSAAAGDFLTGLTTARIPLFLFQAVLASLLPKLSRLAGTNRFDDFLSTLRKLVAVILAVGVLTTIAAAVLGPWVIEIMFGKQTTLTSRDLALLAAAFILIMATICLDQALIALNGHSRMALGWLAAFVTFVMVTALGNDLFLRVELGLLAAAAVAFAWMAGFLAERLRHHAVAHPVDEAEALAEIPAP